MTDIHTLDLEIQAEKDRLKVGDALKRLQSNPDYKLIIEQLYLNEEALRLTSLLASPAIEGNIGGTVERLQAISRLDYFLNSILRDADSTVDRISRLEEEREAHLADLASL